MPGSRCLAVVVLATRVLSMLAGSDQLVDGQAQDACLEGEEPPGLFEDAAAAESNLNQLRQLVADDVHKYHARRQLLDPELRPAGSPYMIRLKASDTGAAFRRKLKCLRPVRDVRELERKHSFDADLLGLKLRRGRACQRHKLCSLDRCRVEVRDSILTREEAAALIAHGQSVLDREGSGARDEGWPYVRVEFMRSAHNGSTSGHVLMMRVAERLRRVMSEVFELPLESVGHAETLLALRRTAESGASPPVSGPREEETMYHVDESLSSFFHFSSVVWLSDQGSDFDGGEIVFLHNRSWPWLVVEPAVGRTAFFSSGWENVHGIKPLTRGQRWALSMVFMVHDDPSQPAEALRDAPRAPGQRFYDWCVHPPDKSYYPSCRESWAATFS